MISWVYGFFMVDLEGVYPVKYPSFWDSVYRIPTCTWEELGQPHL